MSPIRMAAFARVTLAIGVSSLSVLAQNPPPAGAAAGASAPANAEAIRKELDAARRDLQSTKAAMQRQQQDNDRLKHQLEDQRARVESLETKVNGMLQSKEAKEERPKTGLLSIHGDHFELGGILQVEYVDTENETQSTAGATDAPAGHFQVEKMSLIPKVIVNEDISLRAELEFKPRNGNSAIPDTDPEGRAYLRDAYVRFQNFPGQTWIQAGLDRRFIEPNRMTETYPLAGTAFWRDETPGVTIGGEPLDFVYWRASVTDGLRLQPHPVGEDKSFSMIHDDRVETDLNNPKEFGIGLGGKFTHEVIGKFDAMAFVFTDRLDKGEVRNLQALPGYGANTDRVRYRYGVNFDYTVQNFNLFTEVISARDGDLHRWAWYLQPSYTWKFEGLRWLQSVTFFYRYNAYSVDLGAVPANSLTWDRIAHTPALLVEVVPFVTLKFEYNFNREDMGASTHINDDEFLAQLEVIF